ncbi:immunity protein Imm33 domain-containing protein [Algoriphagus resistens]|uniref:immunity protein Imm33 domain-containing protein n=1 Tax=Algoriphagus resistens TaxID=1750590 RepID=UPI0009E78E30
MFSGTETQEYLDNPNNSADYATNTIANYDPAIIPCLEMPAGTELERIVGTNKFEVVE